MANLKFLNSTQALADLDYFIKAMNIEIANKYGAGVRKWLTIGGSYPGALSAWFKSEYTSADAAWSSSGVIKAIEDYQQYDMNTYYSTMRSGQACTDMIDKIVTYVDQALRGQLTPDEAQYVRDTLNIPDDLDNGDYMYYLADVFAGKI